jgi:hypothetical protein
VTPPTWVELLRVDPTLQPVVAALFFAALPEHLLGAAPLDRDGRIPLLTDRPLTPIEEGRWQRALERLLAEPQAAGAVLREVTDRSGRRSELLLPTPPAAYRGGATLVGPFRDAQSADVWASATLRPPWVHDVVDHGGALLLDVFVGDPDAVA